RVIPHSMAGCPRVTHPVATVLTLAGFLVRLACVRHAASVDSEPGSNSHVIPLGIACHQKRQAASRIHETNCLAFTRQNLRLAFLHVQPNCQRTISSSPTMLISCFTACQ